MARYRIVPSAPMCGSTAAPASTDPLPAPMVSEGYVELESGPEVRSTSSAQPRGKLALSCSRLIIR